MFRSNPIATILKLVLLSLAVGLVMRWLDLTPLDLIENLGENVRRFFEWLREFLGWAIDYILLGAIVVVPIWLLTVLVGRLRR